MSTQAIVITVLVASCVCLLAGYIIGASDAGSDNPSDDLKP